jgi:hypothetical protein
VVGLAIVFALASPAAAQLSGSVFQGADGNQDGSVDAGRPIDWQGLVELDEQDPGVLRHREDSNDPDTGFTGGSHELEPGEWRLAEKPDGVDPPKDNIRDMWASVEQSVENTVENTFLYLAFARGEGGSVGGNAALAFELNRASRLWDNDNARIPCRMDGDTQLRFEIHPHDVTMRVAQWETGVTDPSSGCDRTGQLNVANVSPPHVQGLLNATGITNHLGGTFGVGTTLANYAFGEASLNLSALLETPQFDDDCLAFGSIWLHSSTSAEPEDANLKDFVTPRRLSVSTCSASGTKFYDWDADGMRDPPDVEPDISGFIIWADYDDNGEQDDDEPFAITDENGDYVIHDIRPSPEAPDNGTYVLRERLEDPDPDLDWRCSSPNLPAGSDGSMNADGVFPCRSDEINAEANPSVDGQDFGNYLVVPPEPPGPEPPPGPPEPPPGVIPIDPPGPEPPPGLEPPPGVVRPVAPAGPTPPRAGDAARARFLFRRATRRCLGTRVPRVNLRGTRIARVRIFVNGRLRRRLNVRTLQSRVRPRVTLAPGRRFRITARVTFERGSGTPPVSLTRTVRTCPRQPPAPPVTG